MQKKCENWFLNQTRKSDVKQTKIKEMFEKLRFIICKLYLCIIRFFSIQEFDLNDICTQCCTFAVVWSCTVLLQVPLLVREWSGGVMVLGKLPTGGASYNLDDSRARAYCTCSRCGWGLFGHFYSLCPFCPISPSLWETARYSLNTVSKGG